MRNTLTLLACIVPCSWGLATTSDPLALGIALDNTNLAWSTSADFPWTSTNSVTFDGTDSAVSGNRFQPNSVSWLQTTVIGPGTLGYWCRVASEAPDGLEFYIGDALQETLTGTVDWTYRTYSIPPGTNVLTWQYVKDAQYNSGTDRAWLDQVTWVAGNPMPLQEALNTCGATWVSLGNNNPTYWTGQTNVTHDGGKAAQSGPIYNLQQSTLQTTISGVTNVSFWWRVSSESQYNSKAKTTTIYDTLSFYVDGILTAAIDVEEQWQQRSFTLTPGSHTLQWTYAKDASDVYPKGQDCGWVDQVVFNPSLKALPYTLTPPTRLPNGQTQLAVTGEVGCPCQLQVSSNLVTWEPLTNFTTTATTTAVVDAAAANAPVRFYRAVSP